MGDVETTADGGTKHEGFPKEERKERVRGRTGGCGGKGRGGEEEKEKGVKETKEDEVVAAGRGEAGEVERLWNRGSMCRPRVQRVASACALTSSLFLSLPLPFSLSPFFPLYPL